MCPSRPSRHYLSPFAISDICLIIIKIICPKLKSRWSTRLNFKATQALLNIIYNGSATLPRLVSISLQNAKNRNSKVKSNFLSKKDEKLLESVMALLDVALPGEVRSEVFIVLLHWVSINHLVGKVVERGGKTSHLDTPESSVKSGQGGGGGKKRPSSPSSPTPKKVKIEGGSSISSSTSTTHPQYLLLQLTQALMPFEERKVTNILAHIIVNTIIVVNNSQLFLRRSPAMLLVARRRWNQAPSPPISRWETWGKFVFLHERVPRSTSGSTADRVQQLWPQWPSCLATSALESSVTGRRWITTWRRRTASRIRRSRVARRTLSPTQKELRAIFVKRLWKVIGICHQAGTTALEAQPR